MDMLEDADQWRVDWLAQISGFFVNGKGIMDLLPLSICIQVIDCDL